MLRLRRRPGPLFAAVLALITSACAAAPAPVAPCGTSASSASNELDLAAVRALSDAWFAACKKGDAAWLEKNLADDYVEYSSRGAVIAKAEELAEARQTDVMTFDVLESVPEARAFRVSGDVAVETGIERAAVHGKGVESRKRYTSVFVRRGGRWLALSDHLTVIAAP
jgi:ketosteroid isomerase-like protein